MGLRPAQVENVCQESLGETMTTNDSLGKVHALCGEGDLLADVDQALGLHPLDHLRHRGTRHFEPVRDPRLDHVEVVFFKLVDRLAVFLESGVPLRRLVVLHAPQSRPEGGCRFQDDPVSLERAQIEHRGRVEVCLSPASCSPRSRRPGRGLVRSWPCAGSFRSASLSDVSNVMVLLGHDEACAACGVRCEKRLGPLASVREWSIRCNVSRRLSGTGSRRPLLNLRHRKCRAGRR